MLQNDLNSWGEYSWCLWSWWSHCGRSSACIHAVSVYLHPSLSKTSFWVSCHLWKTLYEVPAHLWVGCSSDVKLFLMWATEAGWVGGLLAVLNPGRSLGSGNASLVQARSCFHIKNSVGRQSPASVCSLQLGSNQNLASSPLDSPSVLKAFQSAVWCPGAPSRSFLAWFGQKKWSNTLENPVDVPFNLWGLWCCHVTLFLCLLLLVLICPLPSYNSSYEFLYSIFAPRFKEWVWGVCVWLFSFFFFFFFVCVCV